MRVPPDVMKSALFRQREEQGRRGIHREPSCSSSCYTSSLSSSRRSNERDNEEEEGVSGGRGRHQVKGKKNLLCSPSISTFFSVPFSASFSTHLAPSLACSSSRPFGTGTAPPSRAWAWSPGARGPRATTRASSTTAMEQLMSTTTLKKSLLRRRLQQPR